MTDEEWKKAIENDVPYVPNVKNYKKKIKKITRKSCTLKKKVV